MSGRDDGRLRPMPVEKRAWQDLPLGGVVTEAGSSAGYPTGDWRGALRPVLDVERCTSCMLCWVFCPDAAIVVANGKVVGIDYDFCKGCGICARECPTRPQKAMQMLAEDEEV